MHANSVTARTNARTRRGDIGAILASFSKTVSARDRGGAGEELSKKSLCLLEPSLSEDNRFHFSDRVGDVALIMESIHGIPIEFFPCMPLLMKSKAKQGKNRLINLLGIEVHNNHPIEA